MTIQGKLSRIEITRRKSNYVRYMNLKVACRNMASIITIYRIIKEQENPKYSSAGP